MSMAAPWGTMDPLATLSSDEDEDEPQQDDDSSANVSDHQDGEHDEPSSIGSDGSKENGRKKSTCDMSSKKSKIDYEALSRHGYSGGPSILYVPAPRQQMGDSDWSWSNGKEKPSDINEGKESYEEREHTRSTVNAVAAMSAAQAVAEYQHTKLQKAAAIAEQRALSFSKKEKRKRDLGQSSRAKNYVEEEKRLLRDQGVYSGFDI